MKKLLAVLTLVLFASTLSFAQINKGWDGTKPEVYKGSKNFVFMYSPFVSPNLGSVYSGSFTEFEDTATTRINQLFGVGFQYYVTPEIALQFGLNFGYSKGEPTLTSATASMSSTTFGLSVDANYHFKALYSVSPYLGLNANFGMGSTTLEWTVANTTNKNEYSGNSFGAGVNFGFDWYFTPGLSLGGKYTLGYAMNSQPSYKETRGATTTEYKGPKLTVYGTGIASIMLNVHF
jgi:hypothetical protein